MTVFYYTATGNSLAVAKRVGGNLISIPQVMDAPEKQYKDDVIGVVFPIFSLAPPPMVQTFLEKVVLHADYTFAIGTYGNAPGACMVNLQNFVKKHGYHFDYANDLFMLDNFLPVFEVGAEVKKLPSKKVDEKLALILADIQKRTPRQAGASLPSKAITSALKLMPSPEKNAQKYIVNDSCTKCGVCATACPAKNIRVTDAVKFSDHCEGCLACVHICPQNAIHLKNEKSEKRWRNPEVTVSEIVAANNRL